MIKIMSEEVKSVLDALESFRQKTELSRPEIARELGIPHETFRCWFRKGKKAVTPSEENLSKLRTFLAEKELLEEKEIGPWKLCSEIQEWLLNQNQYSLTQLAEKIGWEAGPLVRFIVEDDVVDLLDSFPPSVFEKLVQIYRVSREGLVTEAKRRTERLKSVLNILAEELAWFRDNSKEARETFRREMDPFDTGYLSSFLTMLHDEGKFQRWLEMTTHQFNHFKKKGG